MKQALSKEKPRPGVPPLRTRGDHSSDVTRRQPEALMMYAVGRFGVIRQPAAHETEEWDEQYAFERLAALRVLAHEVERTTVVTADEQLPAARGPRAPVDQ